MTTQQIDPPISNEFEYFAVSRDLWDTVQYYFLIACMGVLAVGFGALLLLLLPMLPTAGGWTVLLVASTLFFMMVFSLVTRVAILQTWRRFSERFELCDSELRWHLGFVVYVFPLETIECVQPMGIVRLTSSVKKGVRLTYSADPIRVPDPRSSYLLFPKKNSTPGELRDTNPSWIPPPPNSVDIAPAEWQRMIDSVELRKARLLPPRTSS